MEDIKNQITPPEGWMINEEKSTPDEIVLKRVVKQKRFIDDRDAPMSGFLLGIDSTIIPVKNCAFNHNVFVTVELAKSARAMAYISQIMANDERFGGTITDEEYADRIMKKFVIYRYVNKVKCADFYGTYEFLAFHTKEQRDLFLEENKQLVKDFLMID